MKLGLPTININLNLRVTIDQAPIDAALQPIRNQLQLVIERGELMSETLELIKAQNAIIVEQNQSLQTSYTGLLADVTDLKQKLEDIANAGNGATQAQLEELLAQQTDIANRVTATAQAFAALDAETTQDPPPGA